MSAHRRRTDEFDTMTAVLAAVAALAAVMILTAVLW